jgi:hypothetical protein
MLELVMNLSRLHRLIFHVHSFTCRYRENHHLIVDRAAGQCAGDV